MYQIHCTYWFVNCGNILARTESTLYFMTTRWQQWQPSIIVLVHCAETHSRCGNSGVRCLLFVLYMRTLNLSGNYLSSWNIEPRPNFSINKYFPPPTETDEKAPLGDRDITELPFKPCQSSNTSGLLPPLFFVNINIANHTCLNFFL